jgi:regulator of sigma E protease
MYSFLAVIISIIGLGFLILAHEFGHFVVAKATGMRVEEFSLGFGRFLVSKRIGETVYGISALPIGGYVRVTGMHKEEFDARVAEAREEEAEAAASRKGTKNGRSAQDPEDRLAGPRALTAEEIASTPLERRYYAHPLWHKLIFIIAGVTMNVVVAFFLLVALGAQGQDVPTTTVQLVEPNTPAATAGLQAGDKVVTIDGQPVKDWDSVRSSILKSPGKQITLVVQRAGVQKQLTATLKKQADGTGFLGVQPATTHVASTFSGAVSYGGRTTGSFFALIIKGIGWMFSGKVSVTGSQGLAGPVGIITLSEQAVRGGYYLGLLALISINLAILNMLPVLPLDGGHVLFSLIEKIRGRPVSLRTFERVSLIGLGLFVILFLVATSNDIGRIVTGG